ncbi:MAG: THUMP domain-containing protein [Bacteroidota bacterium]|nr:THUMP domain-containing protein [Bacteroidota bacterium]
MNITDNTFEIAVKTMAGLEDVLIAELKELGAKNIKRGTRIVHVTGDKKLLYSINYRCRTALRVLVPIKRFQIYTEKNFYKRIHNIEWSNYFDTSKTFAIDEVVTNSIFRHTKFAAYRTKDAIVDYFRDKTDERPSIDTSDPDIRINLHVINDTATISLDSSGSSLHKRGYKTAIGEAPLNEVLAAGIIKLTGWNGKSNFIDPMCGSGTFAIEAAMISQNIAPGFYRESFGFQKWLDFNKDIWTEVLTESADAIKDSKCKIFASDISWQALKTAQENISNAKLSKDIEVKQCNFFDLQAPYKEGTIIMNPPYDERLKSDDIIDLYKNTGDTFKNNFAGYTAWILSGNLQALKLIGLRSSKRIILFNGGIETRLAKYEMYKGTKRTNIKEDSEEK